jgi:hypothetical protein
VAISASKTGHRVDVGLEVMSTSALGHRWPEKGVQEDGFTGFSHFYAEHKQSNLGEKPWSQYQ